MKGKIVGSFMVLFAIICFQSACLAAAEFEDSLDCNWLPRDVNAEVTAINVKAMEITLKGSGGNVITFAVDKKVKNLSTFAVGDKVKARYYMSLATEVRTPTTEEQKTPFVKLDETCPVPPRATPGSELKLFQNVVKVEMYDSATGFLVVKDSQGRDFWINVNDQELGSKVKTGDVLIVKHSQPYIIGLKKL
jgi:hypothetical protein